ncbi:MULTISPECIES: hypothetical protein [Streptomyces]|uniref:Uncharacterized protein n=1 Tax=Streptomyces solicathayae TaxID=3081768 RepID=A0ABZ0M3L9_9ACTN|nr:hypothetical protein [Streptomyces sp. HUAS YS2]WOX26177.1 hypothetical protein R2D22_34265 [Streptomyces sp. HUAS YS2]
MANTTSPTLGCVETTQQLGVAVPGHTLLLFAAALVVQFALLAAAVAGKLARLDGASYPSALARAAVTFAAVLTLAAALTSALNAHMG